MNVTNREVADYLREVGDIYTNNAPSSVARTAPKYYTAADTVERLNENVATMSIERLQEIPGVGPSISTAIFNYARGLSEPPTIAKYRSRTPRSSPSASGGQRLNEDLANRLEDISNTKKERGAAKAYRDASETVRYFPSKITSAEDAQGISGIGPNITRAIREFFAPKSSRSETMDSIPELSRSAREVISRNRLARTLDVIASDDIKVTDKYLVYWGDDLRAPISKQDMEEIAEVFSTIVDMNVTPVIDSDGFTVVISVEVTDEEMSSIVNSIVVFIRKPLYSDYGDVTVLFQANARARVRLLRIIMKK